MDLGNMSGKFIIGEGSSLQIEELSKNTLVCSFSSIFNYRIIGDKESPGAIDPSGGPMMAVGLFMLNEWKLTQIRWDEEDNIYLLIFER